MDADTKAELDAMADEAMREHNARIPEALAFAREHRKLLTDGVCRITEVKDQLHLPCVGQIWTDLGERFPVFQVFVREQARALIGKRVKLQMEMSVKGTRYVTGMMAMPVDTSTDVWPCPKCGGVAKLEQYRWSAPPGAYEWKTFYRCPACLYQMRAEP